MQRRGNAYHSRMSVPSTHQTPPLCRFNMVEVTDTPGTAPVPESERDPEILYDRHGQPVDGKLTKDRTIVYAGVVVFCILFCSWTAQWTAFALPYWRGDQYHTGGLFQICGTQDLKYLESNHSLVPDPSPNATHPYRCQSIHAYADDLASWACIKDSTNDVCQGSKLLVGQITMSRWFEALTTTLDMIFGITTIIFMLFPDKHPKKSMRNGLLALLGIFLTPWFCVADLILQDAYWERSGVGYFDMDARHFLSSAAQTSIATSSVDLFLQLAFLQWATNRHGWKLVNFNYSDVKMGPALFYGALLRKGPSDEANRERVKRVVDAVMEMGVPEGVTREQVELIAIANNADVNAVIEEVMAK